MIVIGADTHKGTHALAAVDEGTGRAGGSGQIKADDAGCRARVREETATSSAGCRVVVASRGRERRRTVGRCRS
jgi:hypothetical protein